MSFHGKILEIHNSIRVKCYYNTVSKKKNLQHSFVNYTLRTIPELRHHRNHIGDGRTGNGPARTRAGIKHPFLLTVDRGREFGNISRNAGIGHNLEMDR